MSPTVLAIGPATSKSWRIAGNPSARATRPTVGFSPKRPACEAGRRIEPPPSVASASAAMPLATEATAPPLDPPGVSAGSQGLRVGPKSGLSV